MASGDGRDRQVMKPTRRKMAGTVPRRVHGEASASLPLAGTGGPFSAEFTRLSTRGILFLAVAVLLTACGPAPTSTGLFTDVPPTPLAAVAAPTVAATPEAPTPTTLPATATNSPPLPAEEAATNTDQTNANVMEANRMNIQVGDSLLTATLAENSSVAALKEALSAGPITVDMQDYGGMEKVGSLGMDLPRNDEQITTEAGDIILYQGNAFVIYYAPNSWNFTRLGKVDDVTAAELKEILGDGDVTVTLSLPQE